MRLSPAVAAGTLAGVLLSGSGCVLDPGEPVTETRTIERQGAERVQAEISMGVGELEIMGGAASLLEADLRYTPVWKPELRYDVTGFRGRLSIRQPGERISRGPGVSKWKLRLNEKVPLDMAVKMGAGEGKFDLGRLALRNLAIEVGVGELKLDLTGEPKKTVDVQIRGGVGEATIRVPRQVGVEVEAHGGIGEIETRGLRRRSGHRWVNDAYQEGRAAMRVDVRGGIGAINIRCE